jgi:hypothetical protein
VNTSPCSSIAAQNVLVGHDNATSALAPEETWVTIQAPAVPVGLVEVTTSPAAPAIPTHSEVVGQARLRIASLSA